MSSVNEENRRYRVLNVYYELVINNVYAPDILIHLDILQEHSIELKRLHDLGLQKESMKKLLLYLDQCDHPGKWKRFYQAVHKAEYKGVYQCLEKLKNCENWHDYDHIKTFFPVIIDRVELGVDILGFLYENGVIDTSQLQSLKRDLRNHSNRDVWMELFNHLPRRNFDWFEIFLEALLRDQQRQLVQEIDPKFYAKRCETNEDVDWEEDDVIKGHGEAEYGGDYAGYPDDDCQGFELEENNRNEHTYCKLFDGDLYRPKGPNSDSSLHEEEENGSGLNPALVEFPKYERCPSMNFDRALVNNNKNKKGIVGQIWDIFSSRRRHELQGQIQEWARARQQWRQAHSDWCIIMEKWLRDRPCEINNKNEFQQVVDAWLACIQDQINRGFGTITWLQREVDFYSDILALECDDDVIENLTSLAATEFENSEPVFLTSTKNKMELEDKIADLKTKIIHKNNKYILAKRNIRTMLGNIIRHNKLFSKKDGITLGTIGSLDHHGVLASCGINLDTVIRDVREIWVQFKP